MQGYVNSEAVPVCDIKLGIRWRCVISFKFQVHFASEERAPQHSLNTKLDGYQTHNVGNRFMDKVTSK